MYPVINDPQNYSAALYLRLSKEDDKKGELDDSESIKNQKGMLVTYAKEQNLFIYDIYIDDGFTGTTHKRPDFERLLNDIESKKVNMVITKDMSRLSRNHIDSGHYLKEYFPEHRVRYISILDNIDTGDKNYTGDTAQIQGLINDLYAKDISKKIKSVKHDKQKKSLFIGGKAPYGYKKSPTQKNVIVIDKPAAEVVKYIFELALNGKSCREIASILNEKKIATPADYANLNITVKGPYSGKWSSERISFMLQNEVYIGSMVQGRIKKASYKSKKCIKLPRDECQVVENTHEPLIDRESFEKVGVLIQSRNNTRSRTYDYLLKGLIFCYECQKPLGVSMRTLANNRNILYFVCRTYQRFTKNSACTCHCVKLDDVTNAVMEQVRYVCQKFINDLNLNDITESAAKKLQAEKRKQGNDIAALKAQLDSIQLKIDRTYNDKLSGYIAEEDFKRIYFNLKEEQKVIESRIQLLQNSDNDDVTINVNKVQDLVNKFLDAKEYSRDLLVSLVDKIELTENKELIIHFKFRELDLPNHL